MKTRKLILLKPYGLSIIGHLMVLLVLHQLKDYIPTSPVSHYLEKKVINLEQIPKHVLKEYRAVGLRNGSKKARTIINNSRNKTPNFSSLTFNALKNKQKLIKPSPTRIKNKYTHTVFKKIQKKIYKIPKQKILKKLNISPKEQNVLKHLGMGFEFIPPKGIKEDELNTIEKIFYGFHLRITATYINSIVKSYHNIITLKPYFIKNISKKSHFLKGRITYNREGKIIKIKKIRWTTDDNVQELFDEALKKIILPNPPKTFLGNDKQFNLDFHLRINPPRS